jgi:hypothetical protein
MIRQKNIGTIDWNGANQGERMLKALMPEFVKIDERSTSDFLAFASKYAELVRYYDINNSHDGDWTRFLKNDLSVFIATIISTDLKKIEREHSAHITELENAPRVDDRLEALKNLYTQVMRIAKMINDWYEHSLQMNRLNPGDTDELENELENAIKQQLSGNLQEMLEYERHLGFHGSGMFSRDEIEASFHRIWFPRMQLLNSPTVVKTIEEATLKIQDYTKKIRIQFRTFYSVISYIVQIAPKYLKVSLTEKDDHRPDVALFIAFVQMFKHNQDQLNTITGKHLDFYYYDVLRQTERTFSPDKVNLFFKIGTHIDKHFLPEGTLLNAGIGSDGQPLHYSTDYSIELNRAQITSAKTLYVSKNPKIGIGSSYRLITNLYAAPIANSRNGLGERFINNEEEWPSFGEELLEKPESERQMTYAEIGWAIAAPILEMEEGHRVITIKLEFEKASMYTLNLLIKDISKNQDISREDAFSKVFRNSLNIYFSTAEGWTKSYTCEVLPPEDWADSEITIVATLPSSAPSIIGYNREILGSGFETTHPVMKIVHQNTDVVFSYSFLKELMLEKINIDVTVQGIKSLMLFNEYGILESSIPFQPFGAIPKPGSYLLVGKSELFKKDLTDLSIKVEWHNLPDNKKGLRGYYKEYGLSIQNDSYKVRISALSDGEFFPAPENNLKDYRLFHDDEADRQRIGNETTFDEFDIKALNIKPDYSLTLPTVFNSDVRSGYFKIEMITPSVGFAHDEFPNIYSKIIAYNANPKRKGPELPLPKQPWTPVMRSITLDYAATAQVNVLSIGTISRGDAVAEQLFHVHPFGIIRTFHKGRPSNRSLIPAYDEDAYLYLGVSDFNPPSTLSIYLELKENQDYFSMLKGKSSESKKAEVIWSYMINDEWKEFSQNQILSDTTFSLNNSGIITYDIPRDLNNDNNILPKGQFWLRAAIRGDASRMPRILHIATQALSATWVDNGNGSNHLQQPLEGGSIKGLVTGIAQIREVNQPFKSFGGRTGEVKEEFYTRVSERLRHKGRAVAAWDFERLVLERFPNLFQVKCVTHVGNDKFVNKGSVVIVVVPRFNAENNRLPMVNNTTLEAIKEFLKPLASPFVNIEVRNPIYERVKISAGVQFEKGKNNGTFLKKLNQDIMAFMCPWMYGSDKELELGGQIAKDVILSHMEKRDYVEFVTKFSVVQIFPTEKGFDVGDSAIDNSSSPVIKGTKPWSVLIPFTNNPIYLIDDLSFQSPEKAGIDTMMLDGDFVMTEEKEFE